MNIRNTLKSAAIALPLLFGHGNAAAQKVAQSTVKDTARTVAVDTMKAMNQASVNARTFVMNSAKTDSIINAKADSIVNARTAEVTAKKADSIAKYRPKVAVDVSVGDAHHLPNLGTRAHVSIEKGRNVFDASALYATKSHRSTMFGDGSYKRIFPSKKVRNLEYTAGVGLSNTIERDSRVSSKHYGEFSPRVTAGFRYKTPMTYREFPSDSYFAIQAEAGPAAKIKYNANYRSDNNKVKGAFYLNTEAEVGKKHWSIFGRTGHSPQLGYNAGAGIRYKF